MYSKTCKLKHRYYSKFETLDEDQGGEARHKCCGCAYEQGLVDGHSGKSQEVNFKLIPKSQAGNIRHKDALQAYKIGYAKGLELRRVL